MNTRATASTGSPSARTTTSARTTSARTTSARTTTARTTAPRTTAPRTTAPRTGTHRTAGTPRVAPRTRTTPRPELRLVPGVPATRSRRRPSSLLRHKRAPFVLLVVALLVGTTLGLLVLNTAIAVDSLKATHLRTANANRSEQLQRLEQQVVNGSTPAAIARQAAAAGLVPAGAPAHLVIAPDGSAVLRGTPQPAPVPAAAPAAAAPAAAAPAAAAPGAPVPTAAASGPAGGGN